MNTTTDKIFVTGGAGLIGGELLRQLLAGGYHIRALCHHGNITVDHPHLERVQGDVLDIVSLEESLKDITHVFHCAAMVSYHPGDHYKLMKVNVEGTSNIVNACLQRHVRKLVHVSSVAAIGRNPDGHPVNEELPWTRETNNSFYSRSKYLSEMEVWRGIGEGLDAVIVNPALVMGGDRWDSGSSAIFKSVFDAFPWYSDGVNGWVDVQDVARAMILLMNSDITAQRFILSAENLSYKEAFTIIAKNFGKRPPHKRVTPFLAEMVWRLEALKGLLSGKRPLLTKETARTALSKVYYDHSKILKALPGFSFTPMKETFERTCSTLIRRYVNESS